MKSCIMGIIVVAGVLATCVNVVQADWPMAGANSERTSWVAEEVPAPFNPVWYRPIQSYISQNVQVVAAANKLFISAADGLYSLNSANGDLEWVYATDMPLGHSPTYHNGVLYVGGFDRRLHAIDAAAGTRLWTFDEAKAGFRTNPLVADGLVMLGNRDGWFYAIGADGEPNEGELEWKYQTGGPILYSAAYRNGVVYFCSQDMYCYALNTADGSLKWKSAKIAGQGFHSWWPVIYRNWIVLTTRANYRMSQMPGAGSAGVYHLMSEYQELDTELINGIERDEIWPAGGDLIGVQGTEPGDWAAGTVTYDATKAMDYFEAKPWRRGRYFLDANSGADWGFDYDSDGQTDYLPTLTAGTKNGTPQPPVVSGYDDVIYTNNCYRWGLWICRGGICGWKVGTPFISRVTERAIDEPHIASGGGRLIYTALCGDRESWGNDISRNGLGGQMYSYNIHNKMPGYDVMWFGDDETVMYRLWGYYGSLNGIYHLHNNDQNPPIPYNGRVYSHRSNAVVCFGPDTGEPTQRPLIPLQTPPAEALPEPNEAELKQMLADEIQKWVDAGHLSAGWMNGGQGAGQLNRYLKIDDYYQSPAENLWALLRALPHLSAPLRTNARNFIQSEKANYNPATIKSIGWSTGATRDWFDYPPEVVADLPNYPTSAVTFNHTYQRWNVQPFTFYAMWKYAQEFGGALGIYNEVKALITNFQPLTTTERTQYPYWLNEQIAGFWGYLELEALAGQPETTWVRDSLNEMLEFRKENFSKDTPFPVSPSHPNRVNISRNFIYMTPELADYLQKSIEPKVAEAVAEYQYVGPYWFVSRYEGCLQECSIQNLYDTFALLQAKALILQEPQQELAKFIDVPGFMRGDLLYIHNLVSAIEAAEQWAPDVNAGPDCEITLPVDSVLLDGAVSDDGLPDPPAQLTVIWEKIEGPCDVTLGSYSLVSGHVEVSATFGGPGQYVMRLTADDSELNSGDEVYVTVNPEPDTTEPNIISGIIEGDTEVVVTFNEPLYPDSAWDSNNYIIDQGVTVIAAAFGDSNNIVNLTTSALSIGSVYTLTVNDVNDMAGNTIAANTIVPLNRRPSVDAGVDQEITLPASAVLDGTAIDDGRPDTPGVLTIVWSKASGPGTVNFADAGAADTTATFSTDGVYVLRLAAGDGQLDANDTVTITVNPEPDLQAPTVPQNLNAVAFGSYQVNLTWDASTDNVAVTGYRIFRDGNEIDTTTMTAYSDTGLSLDTEYTYEVTAYDGSCNESAKSDPAVVTTEPLDTQAPSVPQNFDGSAVWTRINLTWDSSTDNVAVTGYRIYRGGAAIGTTANTSYSDAGLNPLTQYTYEVTAFDFEGNESAKSMPKSITTGEEEPAIILNTGFEDGGGQSHRLDFPAELRAFGRWAGVWRHGARGRYTYGPDRLRSRVTTDNQQAYPRGRIQVHGQSQAGEPWRRLVERQWLQTG